MKNIDKKKFAWRLFFSSFCLTLLLSGFFYLQKIKVRASNPKSSKEVIKTYFRAISYGEYEKAISLYTERYKKQEQDYEIKHGSLYNKKPLTLVERMKSGRPIMTLFLAPLVDLLPCDISGGYPADDDFKSGRIEFGVKYYGSRRYFVILKKDEDGNWKMDGPPGTGP